jgi:GTPase Era involved in 16S rRNA processing
MMTPYGMIRDALLDISRKLLNADMFAGKNRLNEISEKLSSEQFNLVIMGQFKRGKSTFINALIGAEIAPTAIVPLTSVVTILRYGETPKASVSFLDGRGQDIGLAEIPKFVTEKENPKNILRVKEVEIFYPSAYLKDGVRIVDTPGVGSVYQHNTDVAYSYLPYADAGIFIVTPDPPLGESEHRFLKDVRGEVSKLIFVLNKIDMVDEKDLNESIAFTRDILKKDLGIEVPIFPVSSKMALAGKRNGDGVKLSASRLPEFEKTLTDFLHKEKGKIFLQSIINSLLKCVSDESMACKIEQEAFHLSLEELRAKISRFEEYARSAVKERDQQQFILEGRIKKLHQKIDQDLDVYRKQDLPALLKKTEAAFLEKLSKSANTHALETELENFVFEEIRDVFTAFRNREAEKMAGDLEEIYLEITGKTNAIIENIVKMTSDLFQVSINPFTDVEKLTRKSDFYFLLKDDPGVIDLISISLRSALPMAVAKGIILKRIKDTVSERFERHCGRVRYDLIQRINKTTASFKKTFNEKIDMMLSTIREALDRSVDLKNKSETDVSQTLSTLSGHLSQIDQITETLHMLHQETVSM